MPRGQKKRITFEQARTLYPDEWVVFCDARIDVEEAQFIDGVVYHHGADRSVAFQKISEVKGPGAIDFTGSLRYRKVTLRVDDEIRKAAA